MGKRVFNKLILLAIFFFLFPVIVKASYANIKLSANPVIVGNQATVYISVSADTKVTAIGGYLGYDSNYLTLNNCVSTSRLTYKSGARTAFIDFDNVGITGGQVGYCTFTTKAVGNTSVTINSAEATSNSADGSVIKLLTSVSAASITIKNPPSSNNNLSSLKVTPGSISFNKNTTSYNVSVESNVTSVSITASAEDPIAKISGTGNRNLNYGNNALEVKVTAENGSVKTYTINVNRKDNRSTNNNLASLSVSNGKLSPGFGKNTTSYSVEVPYEVTRLTINAKAEDSKARVNVYSPELIAEETVNATVTVTAENGSNKTYTISIKRGKDPNKVLSTDNYLSKLSVSVGMLSPQFDKEKLNYAVYLPYEISYIVVDTEVSDKRYATVKTEGNNNLSIGNNLFKYTVTAEDGSSRVYTLTVVRNKSLDEISTNTNTYLKSLKLSNGKLTKKFNKKVSVQYYNKKNNKVSIKDAIPEVEENTVTTYKVKSAFVVVVETPTGERGFYILIEKKSILIYIIIGLLIVVAGTTYFIIRRYRNIDPEKRIKKAKKSKE